MKTKLYLKLIILLLAAAAVSGCSTIADFFADETPAAATAVPTSAPTATPGTLGVDAPISLQLWVPPEFDPQGDSAAALLLRERLSEYSRLHPGIRVVTRVKANEGSASLLESLSAAVTAAPLALPDLVLLSTQDARTAAERNLIYALQAEVDFSLDNDWYPFAAELVTSEDQTWGIPFAADVMVMVYRPSLTPEAPATWDLFFEQGQRLMFAAADPQAKFTLALYVSENQVGEDGTAWRVWDQATLESVLDFFNQAQASNLMPYWLVQLNSDQLVWEGFLDGQAELGIGWMSQYLQQAPDPISAARIPTQSGSPATLAKGWVWAVATPNTERQAAAESLAQFLSESDFIGDWTEAAGLLPTRPFALTRWTSSPERDLAGLLLPTATASPGETILSLIGPALQEATMAILKQEKTVSEAAADALNQLNIEGN